MQAKTYYKERFVPKRQRYSIKCLVKGRYTDWNGNSICEKLQPFLRTLNNQVHVCFTISPENWPKTCTHSAHHV